MSFYYVRPSPALSPEVEGIYLNLEHADQAINHLIEFFRKGPRNQAYLRAVCAQLQELEQLFFDLYQQSFLSNAEGTQLDQLGEIVGEARQDRTDTLYRAAIRVRILVNKSNGRTEELITIALRYLEALQVAVPAIYAGEYWPAGLRLDIGAETVDSYLLGMLREAKGGGIRLTTTMYDSDTGFLCGPRTAVADANGCGNRTGTTGGRLAIGR